MSTNRPAGIFMERAHAGRREYDVHDLLVQADSGGGCPAIVGYHRIDGPGSSLSLPLFQIAFYRQSQVPADINTEDGSWAWSTKLPRTVAWTISTGTRVTAEPYARGKLAMESADFSELRHVEGSVGDIPPARQNWILKIMEACGLDGVLFRLENVDPRTRSAGLGGSATITTASVILANYLMGNSMEKFQIVAMASIWENFLDVSMTGTQEQWNVVAGGIADYVWFPCGIPGRGTSFGDSMYRRLIPADGAAHLLSRSILVHSGRPRLSTDINRVWARQLKTTNGYEVAKGQVDLAYRYAESLRLGDWQGVKAAINGYRSIRVRLCPEYVQGTEWLDELVREYDVAIFPLGAGGGGCTLLWCDDPATALEVREMLRLESKDRVIDFNLENSGHVLLNPLPGRPKAVCD